MLSDFFLVFPNSPSSGYCHLPYPRTSRSHLFSTSPANWVLISPHTYAALSNLSELLKKQTWSTTYFMAWALPKTPELAPSLGLPFPDTAPTPTSMHYSPVTLIFSPFLQYHTNSSPIRHLDLLVSASSTLLFQIMPFWFADCGAHPYTHMVPFLCVHVNSHYRIISWVIIQSIFPPLYPSSNTSLCRH